MGKTSITTNKKCHGHRQKSRGQPKKLRNKPICKDKAREAMDGRLMPNDFGQKRKVSKEMRRPRQWSKIEGKKGEIIGSHREVIGK